LNRSSKSYHIEKEICLDVISDPIFSYLNSNNKTAKNYLAIGRIDSISILEGDGTGVFNKVNQFIEKNNGDWIFGYFGYDLKNNIEKLSSKRPDYLNLLKSFFFVPKIVIEIQSQLIVAHFYQSKIVESELDDLVNEIFKDQIKSEEQIKKVAIHRRIKKDTYIEKVKKIKEHIQAGDIYEINFCQEFYARNIELNTTKTYNKLNEITKAPFSAYFRNGEQYLICGSPERYLKKVKNKIISQPIKGTARRGKTIEDDNQIVLNLINSKKEKSENIMIVDLVRNDLSKIASKGSVQVDELFKLYTFNNIHQMISSVSCLVEPNITNTDIIKSTFPMGSMTGVPKIRAMQIIEETEATRRGIFSGALGYIHPNGNFDFNVIIRSIIYNSEKKYASIMAGGAITIESDPAAEYEESLLKASSMIEALNGKLDD
jgi:para-aminobenzoate synthetase component I